MSALNIRFGVCSFNIWTSTRDFCNFSEATLAAKWVWGEYTLVRIVARQNATPCPGLNTCNSAFTSLELALNVISYGLYTRWMYKDTVISIWYSWYHIDSSLIVVIVPVESVLDHSEVMLLGNWEVGIVEMKIPMWTDTLLIGEHKKIKQS